MQDTDERSGPSRGAFSGAVLGSLTLALVVGFLGWPDSATAAPGRDDGRSISTPVLRLQAADSGAGSGIDSLDVGLGKRLTDIGQRRWRTDVLRTSGFSMLGVTWRAPQDTGDAGERSEPVVRARVRTTQGWRPWRVVPQQHDVPQANEDAGVAGTQPIWVGKARAVQVELRGERPTRPTLALIDPRSDQSARPGAPAIKPRSASNAAGRSVDGVSPRPDRAPVPKIRTRKQWGANGSWRNGRPRYSPTIRQVHIHHTASSLNYSRADVPGILRGIYRYHTHNLGWFDIGYNFLVDRFGRAWVGRSGGPFRNVRGAHTLGFNHSSVGIAVIGTFNRVTPRPAVIRTLGRLSAWKLDKYHRKPRASTFRFSEGSDRYPAGKGVWLKVIDGHRDTNQTSCPGTALYKKLPKIRRIAARRVAYFS